MSTIKNQRCFTEATASARLILATGLLTVRWFQSRKNIDGLHGNGLLKTYALLMEDKMAAGAFERARNYG